MAVDRSTASEIVPDGPQGPIRTCVGCRKRAAATDLLRIVVMPGAELGAAATTGPAAASVVPDPRRRSPGRGAYVHPTTTCVELAQRRRVFARALRVSGTVDAAPVSEYVSQQQHYTADHSAGDDEQ